ncbi:hypothetical protein COCOBI_19-1770 [Coccomyxa sp. Obi]|nr:hypothetical protein COCOBI_19-1770 [Coccomyxa sp. Obi]
MTVQLAGAYRLAWASASQGVTRRLESIDPEILSHSFLVGYNQYYGVMFWGSEGSCFAAPCTCSTVFPCVFREREERVDKRVIQPFSVRATVEGLYAIFG